MLSAVFKVATLAIEHDSKNTCAYYYRSKVRKKLRDKVGSTSGYSKYLELLK